MYLRGRDPEAIDLDRKNMHLTLDLLLDANQPMIQAKFYLQLQMWVAQWFSANDLTMQQFIEAAGNGGRLVPGNVSQKP